MMSSDYCLKTNLPNYSFVICNAVTSVTHLGRRHNPVCFEKILGALNRTPPLIIYENGAPTGAVGTASVFPSTHQSHASAVEIKAGNPKNFRQARTLGEMQV